MSEKQMIGKKEFAMKKAIGGLVTAVLVVCLAGCSAIGPSKGGAKEGLAVKKELGRKVVAATPYVKMSKKAKVVIMGTGFTPGQEIRVLFTTMDGMLNDIGVHLKPAPVPNKVGAWVTTWKCGRFVRKKLIKQGAYIITVTDSKYNVLAHAPVAFYAAKKSKKKAKKK